MLISYKKFLKQTVPGNTAAVYWEQTKFLHSLLNANRSWKHHIHLLGTKSQPQLTHNM